jgi:hypothetical protein
MVSSLFRRIEGGVGSGSYVCAERTTRLAFQCERKSGEARNHDRSHEGPIRRQTRWRDALAILASLSVVQSVSGSLVISCSRLSNLRGRTSIGREG